MVHRKNEAANETERRLCLSRNNLNEEETRTKRMRTKGNVSNRTPTFVLWLAMKIPKINGIPANKIKR